MEKKTRTRKKKVLSPEVLDTKVEAAIEVAADTTKAEVKVKAKVAVNFEARKMYKVLGTGKSAAFAAKKQFMVYGFTAERLVKDGFVTLITE